MIRVAIGLLALGLSTMTSHAQSVWGMPHRNPDSLTASEVDPEMWPIVRAINASGWVWTTESCQGHGAAHPVTLGLVTNDLGRVFSLLQQAQAIVYASDEHEFEDPNGWRVTVGFFLAPKVQRGAAQVRLTATDEAHSREVFRRFSEMVTP